MLQAAYERAGTGAGAGVLAGSRRREAPTIVGPLSPANARGRRRAGEQEQQMPWKVTASMAGASVITLAVVAVILTWFEGGGMAWLVERGIGLLVLPAAAAMLFLVGFCWYRLFLLGLLVLRADLDDE